MIQVQFFFIPPLGEDMPADRFVLCGTVPRVPSVGEHVMFEREGQQYVVLEVLSEFEGLNKFESTAEDIAASMKLTPEEKAAGPEVEFPRTGQVTTVTVRPLDDVIHRAKVLQDRAAIAPFLEEARKFVEA